MGTVQVSMRAGWLCGVNEAVVVSRPPMPIVAEGGALGAGDANDSGELIDYQWDPSKARTG